MMDTVLTELIRKLPHAYLMGLVPVLLVSGLYVFTRLRRDKRGKLYFYSQRYEDSKRNRKQDTILAEVYKLTTDMVEMKKFREDTAVKLDTANNSIEKQTRVSTKNRKDILQLQICVQDLPPDGKRQAYREYNELGYNSWVDRYVIEHGLFTQNEIDYIKEDVKR